ncbi:hypothetical protein [Caminibacter sp.]
MLMRLLKSILIASSIIIANVQASDINNSKKTEADKTKIKTISFVDKSTEKNAKTINIMINTAVENQFNKINKKLNKLTDNILLSKKELAKKTEKLEKENGLLKRAIAKMILDIEKIKKTQNRLYIVNGNIINVRKCPNVNCPVVRKRLYGDIVIVEGKEGDWYKTAAGNYIYSKLLMKVY